MSRAPEIYVPGIREYVLEHGVREPEILAQLRVETASHPRAVMQIPPEQGQLFEMLVKLTGARRAIEIGVFTGYSSLATALALPDDGRLIACDISEEFTAVARRYWKLAGVDHKIELRIGPAIDTLDRLLASGASDSFNFVFIDADKTSYASYYERCLTLIRPGGLIVLDNMLQHGQVMAETNQEPDVVAIRELNDFILNDSRVDSLLLPFGDGVTLVRKR
jgi:predicted O-methyltransferase YrrM